MSQTHHAMSTTWSNWEDMVEEILTPIIIAAAKEQEIA
jgi:hypothetical protein